MTKIPEENYSRAMAYDPRAALSLVGDEHALLTSFLDWHRETFRLKCAGLTREQLSTAAIPPSTLTLHGLLRHLAGTERWWF
ncbi:MAG: DinB family protein, partial [Actinomycetota bacterium]|nr:DinB family protein [Actinomycetota bacterium]